MTSSSLRDRAKRAQFVTFLTLAALACLGFALRVGASARSLGGQAESEAAQDANPERDEPLRITPGIELQVAEIVNPAALLASGFDSPESSGAWMTSLSGSLRFSVDSERLVTRISLGVLPFVSDAVPSRRVTISAGGREASFQLDGGGEVIWLEVSEENIESVSVSCDSIDSPRELGLSDDVRPLCVLLIWMRLDV